MKRFYICFFLTVFFQSTVLFSCTTMLISKGATIDGSVIVAHSDDNELGDQRIVLVPAKDHPKGSKRAIYLETSAFPRYVGKDKAKPYDIAELEETKPIGYIDEVPHTYAYIEGNYGIINEHQLAIGECTNSVYFYFESPGKNRLLGISTLSQIALERCTKAKEAVELIGELAEKYGYYTWGETLLIADTEEGWVFEIASTPSGEGALWVAKRVPEGEIFVAANQFRIQEVIPHSDDMLYSANIFDIAKERGWDEKQPLNWLKLVCPGEFDHPYYSLRRVWRVFSRCNPSLHLSPWVEGPYTKKYPFSIKPKHLLTVKDVISLYRDHYEGTQFNTRLGSAAGPYGCPHRNLGKYDRCDFPNKRKEKLKGAWERTISIYYTGYTYVTQLRSWMPDEIGGVTWLAFDDPYTSCFMPLYAGINATPHSFSYGSPDNYSITFAWWPFNTAANWITCNYERAVEDIQKRQMFWEDNNFERQKELEKNALILSKKKNREEVKSYLTNECLKISSQIIPSWWDLTKFLIEKYNDGYINKPHMSELIGYPKWWREEVGYQNGPIGYEENANED